MFEEVCAKCLNEGGVVLCGGAGSDGGFDVGRERFPGVGLEDSNDLRRLGWLASNVLGDGEVTYLEVDMF